MRKIDLNERKIILAIANELALEPRQKIFEDIANALICIETDDGSRRRFQLMDYKRPPYSGQHAYPVEGRMMDADGSDVTVRLYADENERIFELEFIKWSERPIISLRWNTFFID